MSSNDFALLAHHVFAPSIHLVEKEKDYLPIITHSIRKFSKAKNCDVELLVNVIVSSSSSVSNMFHTMENNQENIEDSIQLYNPIDLEIEFVRASLVNNALKVARDCNKIKTFRRNHTLIVLEHDIVILMNKFINSGNPKYKTVALALLQEIDQIHPESAERISIHSQLHNGARKLLH